MVEVADVVGVEVAGVVKALALVVEITAVGVRFPGVPATKWMLE